MGDDSEAAAGLQPTPSQWRRLSEALSRYVNYVVGTAQATGTRSLTASLMSSGGSLRRPELVAVAKVLETEPSLAAAVYRDAAGAPVTSFDTAMVWNFVVGRFLSRYLAETESASFDRATFDALMDSLTRDAAASELEASVVMPLPGLDLPDGALRIDSSAEIRPVSEKERQHWLNAGILDFRDFAAHRTHAAIEVRYRSPRTWVEGTAPPEFAAHERAYRVLLALQLATGAVVGPLFVETRPRSLLAMSGGSFASNVYVRPPIGKGRADAAAQDEIRALMSALEKNGRGAALDLGLRRWSDAQTRFRPDDVIIDCWMALEAVLCPDSTQEVLFRGALRLAALIGSDESRPTIYAQARRSYECRSRLVHGGDTSKFDLQAEADRAREWLRLVIVRAVRSQIPADVSKIEGTLLSPSA